jgi:hypothetical protein
MTGKDIVYITIYMIVVSVLLIGVPIELWSLLAPNFFVARFLSIVAIGTYEVFMSFFIFVGTGALIAILTE